MTGSIEVLLSTSIFFSFINTSILSVFFFFFLNLCFKIEQWEEPDNRFWSALQIIHFQGSTLLYRDGIFTHAFCQTMSCHSKAELWSQIALCCRRKFYAFLYWKILSSFLSVAHCHSCCLYCTISSSQPDLFYCCLFFFFLSVAATNR